MNLAHDEKDAKGERERFEAWITAEHGVHLEMLDGEYLHSLVQPLWEAWQAALVDKARVVAEAVTKEREACAALCENREEVIEEHCCTHHIKPQDRWSEAWFFKRGVVSAAKRCAAAIRARSTQPDAGTVECGCCATGCPAGQCRHAKENP